MRENDPKYYNDFLLYSIYAHTIRYVPHLAEKVHEYTVGGSSCPYEVVLTFC